MYKKYRNLEIIGFFVVSALAIGFHFLYDATGSAILGAIAPVNESIWEHIKIVFFPFLIWTIVEMLILKPESKYDFIKAKSYALLAIPIMLIVFFYTYSGILGYSVTAIDVASTFLYIALAFLISYYAYKNSWTFLSNTAMIFALIILIMLILFTYFPPRLALFRDSVSGNYGIA